MTSPGGLEKAKWKAVSEDAKTGVLKASITKADGSTEDGEAIVGKDTMIIINREQNMQVLCNRVTEEEFKRRVKLVEAGAAPTVAAKGAPK